MTDVGIRPPETQAAAAPPRRRGLLTAPRVAAAFVFVNVVLICGSRVPHQNEYVYLLRLKAMADPSFLRGDWTYEGPFREHLVFNTLFAPVTRVVSIELLGWVGRLSCWLGLTLLVLALARRMGVRPWPAAIALVAWLACQSALVGGDWVFGTFEAKPIAYVLLFGAILFAFRNATVLALASAGLAFAFHPGVGVWSVPALVVVLLVDPEIGKEARRWWWVAALTALPGVWGIVSGLGDTTAPREVWSFVADRALAFHLDPLYFGAGPLVALLLMFVYNVWYCRRASATRELQLLGRFQVLLAPPMFAGMAIYALGADEHLKYFPFRVFPVLTTMLFAFLVARDWPWRSVLDAVRRDGRSRVLYGTALLALALTIVSVNPLKEYAYVVRANYRDWTQSETDLQRTFRWIERSTPPTAVFVLPPSAPDSSYLAERPQIANLKALSFEHVEEWTDRIVALLGPTSSTGAFEPDDPKLEEGYDRMSVATIEDLERRYGAEYLVSRGRYTFPVVHREGPYSVYELAGGS
jgi:hypothetical protein